MKYDRPLSLLAFALLAVSLTACGSGQIGDIFGGGGGDRSSGAVTSVRGVVERVDTRDRVIVVDGRDTRSSLRNAGDRFALHYDDRTTVEYEGRTYRPEDLEPGDEIQARVDEVGNRLVVEDIKVLYDTSSGYGDGRYDPNRRDDRYDPNRPDDRYDPNRPDDRYAASDITATVRRVLTRDRIIELERPRYRSGFDSGTRSDVVTVHYDGNTRVRFQGRTYGPENLEPGDVVDVDVRDLGNRLLAEQIEVVADVRDRAAY